jgi:transcriptional regulator with XRE-family HTH domain
MPNYHRPLTVPANREPFLEKAFAVDDGCTSVAGLAIKLGQFGQTGTDDGSRLPQIASTFGITAIARLVEFARREEGLTPEQYANRIGIGLNELLIVESGTKVPEPRVLHALSATLNISYEKLMSLAGHRKQSDERLEREVLRFAASSGPMDKLSSTESQALHDLLKILHD